LLIEASEFFPSPSSRETARQLRDALAVYAGGRWRRDYAEKTCPAQHKGKVTRIFWLILKTIDAIPGDRTVRAALTRASSRPDQAV
jgi:hypothetical protein